MKSALQSFLLGEAKRYRAIYNQELIINHPIYLHLDRKGFKSALVINFNYTQIPQKIFNGILRPACPHIDFWDVHGTLSNGDIILGVDDDFKLHNQEFAFLRKSCSVTFKGHFVSQKLNSAKEVVIFGHSLGETDHAYFRDLFLNNSKGLKQSITIYDYNKDDYDNHYFQIDKMCQSNMSKLYLDRIPLAKW